MLVSVSGANHGTLELVAPGAPHGTSFAGASTNGTRVFIATVDPLEASDTDTARDIYQRFGVDDLTDLDRFLRRQRNLDAGFTGASADGTQVFFATKEPLEPGDTDTALDVYERSGSTTTLISTGSSGGNANVDAGFAGASTDGTRVFFTTTEPLEPGDTDTRIDVYQRSGSTTTLISNAPRAATADGTRSSRVPQPTARECSSGPGSRARTGDFDGGGYDIFERSGSTITQISTGSSGGNGQTDARFQAPPPTARACGSRRLKGSWRATPIRGGRLRALRLDHHANLGRRLIRVLQRCFRRRHARVVLHSGCARRRTTPTPHPTSTSA